MSARTILLLSVLAIASTAAVKPTGRTAQVPHDPDDPAIWVHPSDASKSLVLGTDKIETRGGLYVFAMDGTLRQAITPLDRPNNVDVEYGFGRNARAIDIAALTERQQHRLRVFEISDNGVLTDIAPKGLRVLEGQKGDASEPMGVALYKRPRDGAVFAIVAPKSGALTNYLWQYRLDRDRAGTVGATLVRRFGAFSGRGEIEAVAVDDSLGYVYYSDERYAIRKYHADPDHPDAARELAVFGTTGYGGDREGLAIYSAAEGTGWIVSSDQSGNARVLLYRREGRPGKPHDHSEVQTVTTESDETDGLDVVSRPLPGYPRGMLVMMNSGARNFLIYDWRSIIPSGAPD